MDYKTRDEVNKEYLWDLSSYYKNDETWEKDYENLKEKYKDISKYENILLKTNENLYNALEDYYDLSTKLSKLYVYASLKHDEDLSNGKYSLYLNKAYSLYNEFIASSSYISPEILKASKKEIDRILRSKKLKKYYFLLEEILRSKKHILKANEEVLITKLSSNDNVFDKVSSMLTDSTLNYGTINVDGKETVITNSNYRHIMTNKCKKTRKECYTLMSEKLKEFTDIFGELLIANMKNNSTFAEIRNYKSTLDMQLFSSNIPAEAVSNLYKVVHQRLDVFQKYLKLLAENIGLEKLEFCDLHAEFLNNEISFTAEEAQMLILESTKIYGNKYHNIIKKAFKEKWIDYGSYKGKKSGAYCTANYGNNPVVLTNFHGKFADVSTLAHELGHAVNFYLSIEANHAHDYANDIFVAEVASLTNEIILSNYIVTHSTNKELKLLAIYNLIDIIQNNLFDACLEGELENIIYEKIDNKEEVSADDLSKCIYDLRKKYYGKRVELDDNIKYLWARRSHYYYPFYLFEYATGVSAAIYVATKIINNEDNMKEKYLEFLSKGSTNYPTNLLKELGIDMTKPEVINNAINYFDYLIDKFNKVSEE